MTQDEHGRVRRLETEALAPADLDRIRTLLAAAFGDDEEEAFTEDDWEHAVGGLHFVLEVADVIVAHASVVERDLNVGAVSLRTGYVEAVAVAPELQGQGHGTRVMREVNAHIRAGFELGALGTGSHGFYERLGWRTWLGPSYVRLPGGGLGRTPDEDGYIMTLATPRSPVLDPSASISCNWRTGDVW